MRGKSLPATALAAALVLTGCSDGADADAGGGGTPSSPAATETSSDASGTPSVEAPTLPAEAGEQSEAGAEAFADYYVAAMNHAQATGDTGPMVAASAGDCVVCESFVELVDEVYSGGGSVEGGEFSTSSEWQTLPADYGAEFGLYAQGQSAPQTVEYGDGQSARGTGATAQFLLYPVWRTGGWQVLWLRVPQ